MLFTMSEAFAQLGLPAVGLESRLDCYRPKVERPGPPADGQAWSAETGPAGGHRGLRPGGRQCKHYRREPKKVKAR